MSRLSLAPVAILSRVSVYGELFGHLIDAGARFVVVGGVAIVLQGVARLTADIDLVLDLEPGNALRAIELQEKSR